MCVYANVNLLMIVYKSNGKFESAEYVLMVAW